MSKGKAPIYGAFQKPTPGLEPGTPSLRVKEDGLARVHDWERADTKVLQTVNFGVYVRDIRLADETNLADAQWTSPGTPTTSTAKPATTSRRCFARRRVARLSATSVFRPTQQAHFRIATIRQCGPALFLVVVRCGRQLGTRSDFCSGQIVSSHLASTRYVRVRTIGEYGVRSRSGQGGPAFAFARVCAMSSVALRMPLGQFEARSGVQATCRRLQAWGQIAVRGVALKGTFESPRRGGAVGRW